MNQAELVTILTGAIVVVSIFLKDYFLKPYIKKKAENLATREDIGEIQQEIEMVKSELHIATQSKLNLTMEERNSIVEFIKSIQSYYNWSDRMFDWKMESEKLNISTATNDQLFNEVKMKAVTAKLFTTNEDLINKGITIADGVNNKLMKLDEHYFKLIDLNSSEQKEGNEKDLVAKKIQIFENWAQERDELNDALLKIYFGYLEEMRLHLKTLA